jgi:parallel beta-helix repeat protein
VSPGATAWKSGEEGEPVEIADGEVLAGWSRENEAAPEARQGVGLLIEGKSDVVIRGASVRGYWQNLVLRGCRNVVIEGGDFSASHQPVLYTVDQYDERDWLDIFDEGVWRTYGGGIVLEDCEECRVLGVRAGGAQNGLMLVNSRNCLVSGCDFSRNSGWGIWMWRSSGNTLTRNNCDACVRCEDPERYSAGGDSAGMMLSNANNHNVITHNSFRFGGDGFFLNGLRVPPSEHNLIAFNDGSHSPHNAFESSFSGYNRFIGNVASNSRFGFWCGYSHHNEFVGNVIENCLEWGIAIEHGYENRILGNELRRNRKGIVLFRREADAQASRDYLIDGNVIEAEESAVTLSETSGVVLTNNTLQGAVALELKKGAAGIQAAYCDLRGTAVVAAEPGCQAALSDCFVAGAMSDPATVSAGAAQPYGEPRLPVAAQPTDTNRADHGFRWYDKRKKAGTLVGTAQV